MPQRGRGLRNKTPTSRFLQDPEDGGESELDDEPPISKKPRV